MAGLVNEVDVIYADFSKTFDTLSLTNFIVKLKKYRLDRQSDGLRTGRTAGLKGM